MFYGNNNSDNDRITEWINNAALLSNTSEKLNLLYKVQEVVLNKTPSLLLKVLPDILAFTTDRNGDVRKWLVGFIEEACKINENVFNLVMPNLHMLLCDDVIQVQKRVIQAANSIYRNMLNWFAKAPQVTDAMEQVWVRFSNIKVEILNMIDSDNDGIRTHSVKFLEGVVLLQTYSEPLLPRKDKEFSLDDVPLTLKFARRRKLEEEANHIFTLLVKFHNSPHISSVNLMACMGALCTIAKSRPEFMQRVIAALEAVHSNLPPTLTPSQVNSVKKHLKLQLLNLLKNPCSLDSQPALTSLLTELGCSSQEINRAIPKIDEQTRKKILKRYAEPVVQPSAKRARLEPDVVVDTTDESDPVKKNEQFIIDNLNIDSVIQIVIATMPNLPSVMPAHFNTNYSPITNAGTNAQIRNLASILASQFYDAGVGPGGAAPPKETPRPKVTREDKISKPREIPEDSKENIVKNKDDDKPVRKVKVKTIRLDQVTKPLALDIRDEMLVKSVTRILKSEQAASRAGANILRNKIVTTLASTFGVNVRETILNFILNDMKSQVDTALAWLYEEYSFMQGFNRMATVLRREERPDQSYNDLLCALLSHLEKDVRDRDILLSKIFYEAPLITEEAVEMLKQICVDETRAGIGMNLLHQLVYRRPTKSSTFITVLLNLTAHENQLARDEAINHIIKLFDRDDFKSVIEEQAIVYLNFLTQPQPPPILFGDDRGRPKLVETWNDEACKACLYLYLALLPIKEILIHELSRVYIQTSADIKRMILRLLEPPIRAMGMDSPELLALVESCPKGAETLVTRVIHILTDKGPPSAVLVAKVRELYQTRVSDVRFLIPVLNGLNKKEIIGALPKLIKLNPVVVKEVFNRLLTGHTEGPITPAELLIALHTIDPTKADLKTTMKATSLCFSEKSIYTQEVLAVVMQQLMEQNPLPTLLMRTVIQSLSLYPRLSGFVMNILQRLILKQVWKQKVVWEGFIKCCQRTKPQSFQVVLQLPATQLAEALTICPDLRTPLLEHIQTFNDTQRAHLPSWVMDVLTGRDPESELNIKAEPTGTLPSEPLPPGMD